MKKMFIITATVAAVLCANFSVPAQADQVVPLSGLIGYWKGNGNANDSSPTGNNGSFSGSYAPGVNAPRIKGEAFNLGTGQVHIPNNSAYNLQQYSGWTVGFWFNTNGIPLNSSNGTFLGQDVGAGENPKWFIDYGYANPGPSNTFILHLNNYSSNPRVFLASQPVTVPNGWNQLTMVRCAASCVTDSTAPNTVSFFLNGQAIGTVPYSDITPNPMVDLVFGYLEPCCRFGGLLEDVVLYNRGLRLLEIQSLAGSPSLEVTPRRNIVARGKQGGPFHPSSFKYQLSSTVGSVAFSISGIPIWLNASFITGTATTSPITVTFDLQNVSTLKRGTYNATIAFTNTTNGLGNAARTATLAVRNDDDNDDDGDRRRDDDDRDRR